MNIEASGLSDSGKWAEVGWGQESALVGYQLEEECSCACKILRLGRDSTTTAL